MLLIRYAEADGLITHVWSAATEAFLLPNQRPNDTGYRYVLSDPVESPRSIATQYRVVLDDGTLVQKASMSLLVTPDPFPADGTTACHITVSPFVPCTLRVNGEAFLLTTEDPTLLLTSLVPARFFLDVALLASHWCVSRTVEAV